MHQVVCTRLRESRGLPSLTLAPSMKCFPLFSQSQDHLLAVKMIKNSIWVSTGVMRDLRPLEQHLLLLIFPTLHFFVQILWGVEAKGVRSQSNDGESGRAHLELLVRREPRSDESPAGATALIKNDVIASDCVVAADGAGSPIRAAAGIKLAGQRDLGHLVNIHFRSKRLGQLLTAKAERAGMLYFVYNEARAPCCI